MPRLARVARAWLAGLATLACWTLMAPLAQAQPAVAAEPGLAISAAPLRAGEVIALDGSLAHPAWQRAPAHEAFTAKAPVFGAEPPERTRVRVLFDERALYVGVEALDGRPQAIRDDRVRYDGVNRTQDFVVVYIDAIGRRSSAQFFRINAAGSLADGLHTAADDSEDFAPDFDWDGAVQRSAQGWTAVLRLPFASLRFSEGRQNWRIMVARRLPREQFHLFTSVPVPPQASSFIATLQPLQGVQLPADHAFWVLRPGVTARSIGGDGPRRQRTEASLDIKWRPRAELVLDATLNPDFSQVELDVPQLAGNSRFALSLTEKRPFFFESADLLRMPTTALYTRSFTQPRGGLRATWRGQGWAGTAFAIRDEGQGLVLLPQAYGTGVALQPASDSLSVRGRHDDGTLALGGLVSARRYAQGRGENTVLGPDLGWQIDDQWRLRGQWLLSRTTAQPDALGELRPGVAQDGQLLHLKLQRQTGLGETTVTLEDVGTGFRHDSGFVNQAGTRKLQLFQSVGWRGGVGPFNDFFLNLDTWQVRDRQGVVVQEVVRPGLWSSAARNLEWWFEVYAHARQRTGPAAPLLAERYLSTGLVMTPARWMPLLDVSLDAGRLADTAAGDAVDGVPRGEVRRGARLNASARLRPHAALEVEPRLSQAWLDSAGERRYDEQAWRWLVVWHWDARQSLRLIAQRNRLQRLAEATAGAFDSRGHTESLTYAFRYSAGSRIYLGATRQRSGQGSPAREELFLKLELDADDAMSLRRQPAG